MTGHVQCADCFSLLLRQESDEHDNDDDEDYDGDRRICAGWLVGD